MKKLCKLGKNNFSPWGCTAFVGLALQPKPYSNYKVIN